MFATWRDGNGHRGVPYIPWKKAQLRFGRHGDPLDRYMENLTFPFVHCRLILCLWVARQNVLTGDEEPVLAVAWTS